MFDRLRLYSSDEFDIYNKPEQFFRALIGYALISDKEFGLDSFIKRDREGYFITVIKDTTEKKRKSSYSQSLYINNERSSIKE